MTTINKEDIKKFFMNNKNNKYTIHMVLLSLLREFPNKNAYYSLVRDLVNELEKENFLITEKYGHYRYVFYNKKLG